VARALASCTAIGAHEIDPHAQLSQLTRKAANPTINYEMGALRLATDLRTAGIDTTLDQWDLHPGQDIVRFMEQGVSKSDRVILICSDVYVAARVTRSFTPVRMEADLIPSRVPLAAPSLTLSCMTAFVRCAT
jgi:hypothetical protein